MTATTFHRVRSSHPEDDAEGRSFGPGELVPNLDLTSDEFKEFNQSKVDDGIFYEVDAPDDEQAPEDEAPEEQTAEPNATRSAKRLAEEKGIDLSTIIGSGPDNRIEKSDVQAATDGQEDANEKGGN